MSLREKCIIHGRVQGVFFRASTKQQADKLGIKGYVKNLTNGSVEVLACGNAEAVGHLKAWLWQGPPTAHVSEVKCQLVEDDYPDSFDIV